MEIMQCSSVSRVLRGSASLCAYRGVFLLILGLCISCKPRDLSHRQIATQQKSIEHIWSFTLCYYNSANKAIPFKGTVSTIRPWEERERGKKRSEWGRDIICNVKLQPGFAFSWALFFQRWPVSALCPIQIGIFHGSRAITIPLPPRWMRTINMASFFPKRCFHYTVGA